MHCNTAGNEEDGGMMRRFGLGLAAVAAIAACLALALFAIIPDDLRDPTEDEIRTGILAAVRPLASPEELERQISESLDADNPEEAEDLFELADLLGIAVDPVHR